MAQGKGIDNSIVVALHNGGLKNSEIARATNTTPSNIHQLLKRYNIKLKRVENFKKVEDILQNGVKQKVIEKLAKSKASPDTATDFKNLAIAYEKIYHCNRLQEEKSTTNLAIKIEDITPERAEHLRQIVKELYK